MTSFCLKLNPFISNLKECFWIPEKATSLKMLKKLFWNFDVVVGFMGENSCWPSCAVIKQEAIEILCVG